MHISNKLWLAVFLYLNVPSLSALAASHFGLLLTDDMVKSRATARNMTPEAYLSGNLLGQEVTAADVAQQSQADGCFGALSASDERLVAAGGAHGLTALCLDPAVQNIADQPGLVSEDGPVLRQHRHESELVHRQGILHRAEAAVG